MSCLSQGFGLLIKLSDVSSLHDGGNWFGFCSLEHLREIHVSVAFSGVLLTVEFFGDWSDDCVGFLFIELVTNELEVDLIGWFGIISIVVETNWASTKNEIWIFFESFFFSGLLLLGKSSLVDQMWIHEGLEAGLSNIEVPSKLNGLS